MRGDGAIRALALDRSRRLSLGEGARRRAASVGLWSRKMDQMDNLYALILRQKTMEGQAMQS